MPRSSTVQSGCVQGQAHGAPELSVCLEPTGWLHLAAELRAVLIEAPDTRFKYSLTCRRILEAMNSAYRDSPRTHKKHPVNWAYMNPQDMTEEGIEDHACIEIQSEAGHILGIAKAEARLRRGVLSMTHLYGSLEPSTHPAKQRGSHTGRLTSLRQYLEPINFMPRFSGIPINIRLAAVDAPDQWR
jgi:anaerobic selenocysteine-containing dehydrogenase